MLDATLEDKPITVIAFDGKTIAADGMSLSGTLRKNMSLKKLVVIDGICLSGVGFASEIEHFIAWWRAGQDKDKFPIVTPHESLMLVIYPDGRVQEYDGQSTPVAVRVPMAWGAGRTYALGAMLAGGDARRAVEIACELDNECGGETQVITLDELKAAQEAALKAKEPPQQVCFDPGVVSLIDRAAYVDGIQFPPNQIQIAERIRRQRDEDITP